jgi:transaldolase
MNPLLELADHGQSYWLDNLTRAALKSGELARRVNDEGLRGVTSNPKTLCDAVIGQALYTDQIKALAREGLQAEAVRDRIAIDDVRDACDVLRPAYDASKTRDGFVSLEVSPRLAHDTEASIREAKRLARLVDRPNLMIKIPGTRAGVAAVEQLLYEGLHVNVTLLFSVERYAEFAAAYVNALERRRRDGRSIHDRRSVASFFLSRIDVLVDPLIAERAPEAKKHAPELARDLPLGRVAVANAKLAYQHFKEVVAGPRWAALASEGAQPQRLLWASTSPKNPKYPPLMYVEPLIGPDTVNTMPEKTIAVFAEHGVVADTLEQDLAEAKQTLASLDRLGIDFTAVASQLEAEGIKKFLEPEAKLLAYLEREGTGARASPPPA